MTNKEKLLQIYNIYQEYLNKIYEINIKEKNLVLEFEREIDKVKINQIENNFK